MNRREKEFQKLIKKAKEKIDKDVEEIFNKKDEVQGS